MFFKTLVDKKRDKLKFKIIPKTNEDYVSVKYGCIIFIDSYRFLSSSLDSLVKTLFDNSHKTLKDLKDEIIEYDELKNIVKGIVEDYKTNRDLKKGYPDKIEKLEEAPFNYMEEIDLKVLKTEFPDKWKN